ncbi:MAG: glycosyltransferase family 39 protein [Candidatus Binatia bacterium]
MKRSPLAWFGAGLLALAVVARLHNAWAAPVLAGYDAFAHFTYIWFVADTGRVPLPTHGWSFFHPPLYYWLMAGLWNALAATDPVVRLKVGKLVIALLGCLPALIAWHVVGRRFPGNDRVRLMAAAVTLLIPVQLYSAGFLGNEGIHAVLGSLSLLAVLGAMKKPTWSRAILLGICLGLAMLAKFSAVAVAAGCLAALAAQALIRRELAQGAKVVLAATAAMLVVCGPYYARNVDVYGRPFQLSRDTFMVSYVEGNQPQAARGWADYLTFDPLIFRRPVWPRGSAPQEDKSAHGFERAMRESVWTGLYANTWFDGFGGWVLPPVVESEGSRRAGQALLTLGLLPTGLMVFGAFAAVAALRRRGWDNATVAFACVTAAMLALFVYGTRQAPIAAAVKATYFTPVSLVFALWFAEGFVRLERSRPRWSRLAAGACAVTGLLSLAVFWQGFLFDSNDLKSSMPRYVDAQTTQAGIVEYAGGRKAEARLAFERAAASDYHLAWENLAFLAIDDGRLFEGLRLLRRAARLQADQADGGPVGRERFLDLAAAEYDHSMAVVLHGLGRRDKAVARWYRALGRNPLHGEALYCLALARLEDALADARSQDERRVVLHDARLALASVRAVDPGLKAGWQLAATVEAVRGDCDEAQRVVDEWQALPWWTQRLYPAETGTGAGFSASIGRRRLIAPSRDELLPPASLARCNITFP